VLRARQHQHLLGREPHRGPVAPGLQLIEQARFTQQYAPGADRSDDRPSFVLETSPVGGRRPLPARIELRWQEHVGGDCHVVGISGLERGVGEDGHAHATPDQPVRIGDDLGLHPDTAARFARQLLPHRADGGKDLQQTVEDGRGGLRDRHQANLDRSVVPIQRHWAIVAQMALNGPFSPSSAPSVRLTFPLHTHQRRELP
jgi:hypothetical protein